MSLPEESAAGNEELHGELEALFAPAGPLARLMTSYKERPEQLQLAQSVGRALQSGEVLLGDCPTGTGKSAAYLGGALVGWGRAVVSTATLALQNQLLTKDLPLIRDALCDLRGYPREEGFTFAVMKGRANFLCDRRYTEAMASPDLLSEGQRNKLERFRGVTTSGDREDLEEAVGAGAWLEVASDGEDCAPHLCPFRDGCFYYAHREAALEADVIVVNHALLMANAATEGAIFDPEGRCLIADEAHRLEDSMASAFGAKVSFPRVRYVARMAARKSASAAKQAEEMESAGEVFFSELMDSRELGSEEEAPSSYGRLLEAVRSTRRALSHDPREEANVMAPMAARLSGDLKSFYTGSGSGGEGDQTHALAVVEGKAKDAAGRPYPQLQSWLVETAEVFREEVLGLFPEGGAVLTSATLADSGSSASGEGRSFSYVRERLGLQESDGVGRAVGELSSPEVFDYPNRALIYLPEGGGEGDSLPTVGSGDYTQWCIHQSQQLVEKSGGRALVLLSTTRAVEAFREGFKPPYPVAFQGDDSPGRLIGWLSQSSGGVLVGTATFWQGVDIPGQALSLVVIDKVPFPHPEDPVIKVLTDKVGSGWFPRVSLPRAKIAMRQGAGRLIRSDSDRGVIAVLDPRVGYKSWGKAIRGALPDAPSTSSLEEVGQFFCQEGREP